MENKKTRIGELFNELINNSHQFNLIIKELNDFDINLYSQTGNAYLVLYLKNMMLEQGESQLKIIETIELLSKLHLNFGENLNKALNDIKLDMFKDKTENKIAGENKHGLTKESYTQSGLAEILKVSDKTIREFVKDGLLKEIKLGNAKNSSVKYMRNDIIDFLDENPKNVETMNGISYKK